MLNFNFLPKIFLQPFCQKGPVAGSRVAFDAKERSHTGRLPEGFDEFSAVKPGHSLAVTRDESLPQDSSFAFLNTGGLVSIRLPFPQLRRGRQFAEVKITNTKLR